jgi:hypothetical protein
MELSADLGYSTTFIPPSSWGQRPERALPFFLDRNMRCTSSKVTAPIRFEQREDANE